MDFVILDKMIRDSSPELVAYLQKCEPVNTNHSVAANVLHIVNNMINVAQGVFEGRQTVWIQETESYEDIRIQHGYHHLALLRRQYLDAIDTIVNSDIPL